ncbi:MAG: FHIPEP family type III secretion protein [Turneriella sp.]|nr:FHIPEP family type III secretion protein [Turneriella sp.]
MSGVSPLGLILELGYNWVPHFDIRQGGTMLSSLTALRLEISKKYRKEIRPIQIRDNQDLKPDGFCFISDGFVYEKGWVPADFLLVADPGDREHELLGIEPYPVFFEPMLNMRLFVSPEKSQVNLSQLGLLTYTSEDVLLLYLRRALGIEAFFFA